MVSIFLWQTWRHLQTSQVDFLLLAQCQLLVMATLESSEPMGSGRRKLQGALDELVQQSKEVEEKQQADLAEESAMEEAAKSLVELPNSIKMEDLAAMKKKSFVSPKKRRRRRKKELISTSDDSDVDMMNGGMGRHIPHVMTLFDRRVDLARFSEATPLYVMCREWMRNHPQRKHSRDTATEQASGDPQEQILSFPSPVPLGEGQRSVIPEPLSPHGTAQNLDQLLAKQAAEVNGEGGEREMLDFKKQHLQRWKTIRSRWVATTLADQERYRDSLKVLRDMFQR